MECTPGRTPPPPPLRWVGKLTNTGVGGVPLRTPPKLPPKVPPIWLGITKIAGCPALFWARDLARSLIAGWRMTSMHLDRLNWGSLQFPTVPNSRCWPICSDRREKERKRKETQEKKTRKKQETTRKREETKTPPGT